MGKYFLFVVLTESDIVNLFAELRRIFTGKDIATPVHITLRGPLKNPIEAPMLREAIDEIGRTPILINGVGQFEVEGMYYVYMKAKSAYIERFMFKPDYPKNKYNANPHITIYEGGDIEKANKILAFLKKEIKPLYCHNFEITSYLSKQLSLPFLEKQIITDKEISRLISLRKVRNGIFERASAINTSL